MPGTRYNTKRNNDTQKKIRYLVDLDLGQIGMIAGQRGMDPSSLLNQMHSRVLVLVRHLVRRLDRLVHLVHRSL